MIDLPDAPLDQWLDALPSYQRDYIRALLPMQHDDVTAVAQTWLTTDGPSDTRAFGGINQPKPFWDNLLMELTKFLCTEDPAYAGERSQLAKHLHPSKGKTDLKAVVIYLAGVLAAKLGVLAALLLPPLALLLYAVCKMSVRAWCQSRGCPV